MDHYAGIDVSLECSSVCVVDASGKIVREGKVATEPAALIAWLGSRLGLCRSGFLQPCGRRALRLSCLRHVTYALLSRQCQ